MYRSSDNGFEGIALEFQQQTMQDTKRMADAMEKIAELLASIDARLSGEGRTDPADLHRGDFPKNAKPGDIWPVYDN